MKGKAKMSIDIDALLDGFCVGVLKIETLLINFLMAGQVMGNGFPAGVIGIQNQFLSATLKINGERETVARKVIGDDY